MLYRFHIIIKYKYCSDYNFLFRLNGSNFLKTTSVNMINIGKKKCFFIMPKRSFSVSGTSLGVALASHPPLIGPVPNFVLYSLRTINVNATDNAATERRRFPRNVVVPRSRDALVKRVPK